MKQMEMTFGRGRHAYTSKVNVLEMGDQVIILRKGRYLTDRIITITKITDTQASGESIDGMGYRFKRVVYGSEAFSYRVEGYGTDSHHCFSLVTPKLLSEIPAVNKKADEDDARKAKEDAEAEVRWAEWDAKKKEINTPIAMELLADLPQYVQYLSGSKVENLVHWLNNFKEEAIKNRDKQD